MPKIKIDLIQEGMVVGSDVKNIDNMLLIPAGCTLSERQINILRSWGVHEVEVEASAATESQDPLSHLPPEELVRLVSEVKERFWQIDESNPVFMEIFKLALQRRIRSAPAELTPA